MQSFGMNDQRSNELVYYDQQQTRDNKKHTQQLAIKTMAYLCRRLPPIHIGRDQHQDQHKREQNNLLHKMKITTMLGSQGLIRS